MKAQRLFVFPMTCLAFTGMASGEEADRPNILWLTYEDTSPHFIGCYGNEGAHTPAMDALANDPGGVRFSRAYSNSTVSSPSRSCLITGMDVNVLGTNNHRYERAVPADVKAFPYYLRQAGYYTSNNVKTDYNVSNATFISDAWNESSSVAHWRNRPSGQPFFSVFNIMYSHQSYVSRNDYASYLTDVYAFLDADRVTSPQEALVPDFYKAGAESQLLMARMQNCINYTDQLIEERLDELKADGLDENTIVFVFADHGEGIPRGKTTAIGMGYRVPFIVWFPEKWRHLNPFESSVVTDRQICFEDLAPTILQLAGVEIPEYMNGKPIFDPSTDGQEYIHGSRNRIDDSPGIDRSVIKGRYIYTRVFCPYLPMVRTTGYAYNSDIMVAIRRELNDGGLTDVQAAPYLPSQLEYLYDMEADKWEMNNLAGDPQYADLLAEFRGEMVRYSKAIKDLGFMPEFEMQRRSASSTPMEIRDNFDVDAVVDAAMLVGEEGVKEQQLEWLSSTDPLVRYWAAVGIYAQGEEAVPDKEKVIACYNAETFESAKLKLAAFLYKYCNYQEARATIDEYSRGENNLLANEAVLMIQDMGDKMPDFQLLINEIKSYWQTNDKNYCASPSVNVAQLLIRDMLQNPFSAPIVCGERLRLKNCVTLGFLDGKDDNSTCQTYLNDGSDEWVLEEQENGYFVVRHYRSGKVLTMNGPVGNGIRPVLSEFAGNDAQLWNLRQYRNGFFLENKATGRPLQVNSQSKNEGAAISRWEWNGKQHFVWQLVPVESSAVNAPEGNVGFELVNVMCETGRVYVALETTSPSRVYVDVYDMAGRCLCRQMFSDVNIGVNSWTLECNAPGDQSPLLLSVKQSVGDKMYKSVMKFVSK